MKKILLYLLAAVLMTVGCEKNNAPEPSEEEINEFLEEAFWDQTEVPEYEVTSKQTLTPQEMADFCFGPDANIDSEVLETKTEFLKQCKEQQEELQKEDPDNQIFFVKATFHYTTPHYWKDQRALLSGFLAYACTAVEGHPVEQDHIIFCCPYTHTLESECATESNGGKEFLTYLHQSLFIMPDGQGFGETKNTTQTYLLHTVRARQYYDALVAGYHAYTSKYEGKMASDWTLRVVGASQGAADAIALHRYLDTNNKHLDLSKYYNEGKGAEAERLCEKYGYPAGSKFIEVPLCDIHKFEYSFVCSGPYCPEATMQAYHEWKKMSYPCVIPLVIKSMKNCTHGLDGYEESEFFSEAWDNNKADFDKIYLEKTMKSYDLNYYLCEKLGHRTSEFNIPMLPLDAILSQAMGESDSDIYKALMACLREQDLTSGWTPKTKAKIMYTKKDEVVPCVNSQELINLFKDSHCRYEEIISKKSDHVACCTEFVKKKW